MALTLNQLKPHLLDSQLEERKCAQILEKIKVMYTIDRKGLPTKEWTESEVSAYSSFYLPTNLAKFEWVMNQLSAEVKMELANCDVIDFGTGPGTYLLAFCEYFKDKVKGNLIGVDKEELMLNQAKRFMTGLFPQYPVSFLKSLPIKNKDNKKLLIFGNSCNELSSSEIINIINHVEAEFVLFIEPGTPKVYDQMMVIRNEFRNKEFECLYPCPSIKAKCPVMGKVNKEGQEDWCHQVWRGTHDQGIERLGQMAKMDRKVMPLIAHLYSYSFSFSSISSPSKGSARFIRYLNESKHAYNWEVCLLVEHELKVIKFEIVKKMMSKPLQKEFKKLSVGTNFNFELIKKVNDELYRVKVDLEI